jgi:hypothetical protein
MSLPFMCHLFAMQLTGYQRVTLQKCRFRNRGCSQFVATFKVGFQIGPNFDAPLRPVSAELGNTQMLKLPAMASGNKQAKGSNHLGARAYIIKPIELVELRQLLTETAEFLSVHSC